MMALAPPPSSPFPHRGGRSLHVHSLHAGYIQKENQRHPADGQRAKQIEPGIYLDHVSFVAPDKINTPSPCPSRQERGDLFFYYFRRTQHDPHDIDSTQQEFQRLHLFRCSRPFPAGTTPRILPTRESPDRTCVSVFHLTGRSSGGASPAMGNRRSEWESASATPVLSVGELLQEFFRQNHATTSNRQRPHDISRWHPK